VTAPGGGSPEGVAASTVDGVVLALDGNLDLATAADLEDAVREHVRHGALIQLDAADLMMCDSTGLGAIVRAHRQAVAGGARIVVRDPRPYVADLLAMTGLERVIEIRSH
jgi:anti-sigma B factor antagonist